MPDDSFLMTSIQHQQPSLFRWESHCAENNRLHCPERRQSNDGKLKNEDRPAFLAQGTVGPNRPPLCRRPPQRSPAFHETTTSLHDIPVTPIEFCGAGDHTGNSVDAERPRFVAKDRMARVLQDIVVDTESPGKQFNLATIVFAIRVPGCGQCREHGIQLSELRNLENVSVKGVIKETGVDDESLLEFYTDYFKFPLYKDEGLKLYNLIGNKKLDTFTIFSNAKRMHDRVETKGIRSSPTVKGEGLTQGGVLIFDRVGRLRYVYYETFGEELDMEAIRWAVADVAKH